MNISLINSIFNKKVNESYYWLNKIESTKLWQIIWEIYYDYFAMFNSKEHFIIKRQKLWEQTKDVYYACFVVRNFINFRFNNHIKLMREYQPKLNFKGYKNIPKLFHSIPAKYHNLVMSIYKQNWKYVCHYLSLLIETTKSIEIYEQLLHYFSLVYSPIDKNDLQICLKKWNQRPQYISDLHYLYVVIAHVTYGTDNDPNINNNKIYIKPQETTTASASLKPFQISTKLVVPSHFKNKL